MAGVLKYNVLYDILRGRILSGVYPRGHSLPREVDMAEEFGVARNTLRRAMAELENEGLIRRVKSKGTFVRTGEKQKAKYLLLLNDGGGIENPYQYITPNLQRVAELNGVRLEMVCQSFLRSLPARQGAEALLSTSADGVIALANNMLKTNPLYAILKSSGLPILLPHGARWDREMTGFAVLRIDFARSMMDALQYLSGLGHRKIAVLTRNLGESGYKWNRALLEAGLLHGEDDFAVIRELSLNAFRKILREYGLSDDPSLIQFTAGAALEIRHSVNILLQLPEPPTALIGFSDFYAMHAMQELKLRGIRIPEDMSVLGLCGYPGGACLSPALTTLSYDYEKIGWKCIELMPEVIRLKRMGGEMPDVVMAHRLIERQSTALLI